MENPSNSLTAMANSQFYTDTTWWILEAEASTASISSCNQVAPNLGVEEEGEKAS